MEPEVMVVYGGIWLHQTILQDGKEFGGMQVDLVVHQLM